jgi:hypothetical protein
VWIERERERDFMPKTVGEEGRKVVWLKEKSGLLLTKKKKSGKLEVVLPKPLH